MTLYAVWQSEDVTNYKIILHSNFNDEAIINYVGKNELVNLPDTPFINQPKGFLGWALYDGGSVVYKNKASFNAQYDIELYAVWGDNPIKEEYKISFDNTGAYNCNLTPETRVYGVTLYLEYQNCEKSDYVFLGWSDDADDKYPMYKDGDDIIVTRDMTLYAIWAKADEANSISFDYSNGTKTWGSPNTLYVRKGGSITLPSTDYWKNTGVIPVGYSIASKNADSYEKAGAYYTPQGNDTLYVVWKDGSDKNYASKQRWVYGVDTSKTTWEGSGNNIKGMWSSDANWYDTYQEHYHLCWAASGSNQLLWWYNMNKDYVDRYSSTLPEDKRPVFTYDYTTGESSIFNIIKKNLNDNGNFPPAAINYYIFGLSNTPDGAYFKDVFQGNTLAETLMIDDKALFNSRMTEAFNDKKNLLFRGLEFFGLYLIISGG